MYFSLITPTPGMEREAAIEWAKGPYEQHQWLWKFLPAEAGTQRDFLFRRRDGENNSPGFYLLSAREPVSISSAWQVHAKPFNPQLIQGQQFSFDLRVNPVVTHTADGKSRRDDVVMHRKKQLLAERGLNRWSDWSDTDNEKPLLYDLAQESCTHWLDRRAETYGFRLLDSEDGKQLRVDGYLQQRADKKGIRFSTVDFSGLLEVVDPERFAKSLINGIGKAKAFGCGLMLIRRV